MKVSREVADAIAQAEREGRVTSGPQAAMPEPPDLSPEALNALTEAQFTTMVVELAKSRGWKVFHQLPARKKGGGWASAVQGHCGFTDLVLLRELLIVVEIKTANGKLSLAQEGWRDAFMAAGVRWECWRPADWPVIKRVLF